METTFPRTALNIKDQICRGLLIKKLSSLREGRIEVVEMFGGPAQQFVLGNDGADSTLVSRIKIRNPRAYTKIVLGGTIGAGEAYTDGDWDSDELVQLVRILVRNREQMTALEVGAGSITAPLAKWFHLLNRNSIEGSRKNISAHYDLGNDFFALFLDPSWMYSSGYFKNGAKSLEDAQNEKMHRICKALNLGPQDHLLEIGTGWGGFAIFAAKHYGCKVTTTTISKRQHELAAKRIDEHGLTGQIELLFEDYRLLTGTYDKLVSIEMIEAVGLENLPVYFKKCSSLLKPGGQMVLQAITIRDQLFESAKRNVDFIQRYIFPGSGIPSIGSMVKAVGENTDLQWVGSEDFGQDYARTLQVWSENLKANHSEVLKAGYSDSLYRMWQYYFGYCQGGFLERSIGVSHVHLLKPGYSGEKT